MLQKRKALWRGIRRHGTGWQITVAVVGHPPVYEQFPITATPGEMQARRTALKADLKRQKPPALAGTFAKDAANYLTARAAMITVKTRARHIALWVAEFRHRPRSSIKPWEIAAVRDRWLTEGPRLVTTKGGTQKAPRIVAVREPLSASQVNHRLRALENLWTVLDGRRADNPVREAGEAHEPPSSARGLPYAVVEAILATMPDRGQGVKGQKRSPVSLTKLRLRAIAYTGLSHGELMKVTADHLHLDETPPWVLVRGRSKGKGTGETPQPLTAQGVGALRALVAAGGLGVFSPSPMYKSFQRACRQLELKGIRPYDLRHAFAGETFKATGNLSVTQLMMRHKDQRTTLRYALGAVDPVLAAAIEQMQKAGRFATASETTGNGSSPDSQRTTPHEPDAAQTDAAVGPQ